MVGISGKLVRVTVTVPHFLHRYSSVINVKAAMNFLKSQAPQHVTRPVTPPPNQRARALAESSDDTPKARKVMPSTSRTNSGAINQSQSKGNRRDHVDGVKDTDERNWEEEEEEEYEYDDGQDGHESDDDYVYNGDDDDDY